MLQASKHYSVSIFPLEANLDRSLPDKTLLTLMAMGVFTEKDGRCCVTRTALADMLKVRKLSCAEITNHIKTLVERGYVSILECPEPENDNALCLYRLEGMDCDPNQPIFGRD